MGSPSFDLYSLIPLMVTDNENEVLLSIPGGDEIKDVIFQLNPSSAPGPDGSLEFFIVPAGILLVVKWWLGFRNFQGQLFTSQSQLFFLGTSA